MPIVRKIYRIGESRAISLPKTWLEVYETREGKEIRDILMTVNEKITIEPYIPPKEEPKKEVKSKGKEPEEIFPEEM